MDKLESFSVKIKNFKCFGNTEQGFEQIKPINIIIGRNNSGKSSLLDLIKSLVENNPSFPKSQWNNNKQPELTIESPLTEDEVKRVFRPNTARGGVPGNNHWEYGRYLVGTKLKYNLNPDNKKKLISIDDCPDLPRPLDQIQNSSEYMNQLANSKEIPLLGKTFKRICAERDIVPETDNKSNLGVENTGKGITNIIQNFINKSKLPSELVEKKLLNELNKIFNPDANFIDIVCQQVENGDWEIFLEEESKGRIALSDSGSGVKTIIMVLVYIYLIPFSENKELAQYVFAFEELENNLHPALLRRLLTYLYKISEVKNCMFFLTTHSNVSIDFFSKNNDAQIIHITHNGNNANCRKIATYVDNMGVLDDLDVRASDLLQSNCIIWVEGPSDRIYINKWIDLCSNGELQEGTHYQCVFYGGRLLSHLSAASPDDSENGVVILRVNRNAIILIDSDKKNKQSQVNSTKKRLISEIENLGGIAWVTKGKEIENYIPAEAVKKFLSTTKIINQVGQFDNFFDYLDSIKSGEGTIYSSKKPLLAEKICPHLTKENLNQVMDLKERLDSICEQIKAWNK